MAEDDLLQFRRDKLAALEEAGVEPFPARATVDSTVQAVRAQWDDSSAEELEESQPVVVLPDREPEGTVTVSGHDLRTGERIWGPEEPPGPGPADTEAATPGPGAEDEGHLDPATGTLITLEGTTLSAEAADGSQLWTLSVEEGTRVAGLAGGLLYLREGDAIRAHNAVTGAVAQAYDPDGEGRVVVPRMMVTHGAALLLDGDRPLIATAPEASPAPGMAPTP